MKPALSRMNADVDSKRLFATSVPLRPFCSKSSLSRARQAFTLLELLLVVSIIAILAALLLPSLSKAQAKGKRAQCLNNLKQIGIGFHSFLHDHGDKFPMQVSTNIGGSLEFLQAGNAIGGDFYFAFRHLQALSNELGEPKLLICAADTRSAASDFSRLKNDNVSYFIGATADYSQPDSILAGDRNIIRAGSGTGPILVLGHNDGIAWTAELHEYKGNLLFADGRAEQLNSAGLLAAIGHSPLPQNTLLTPIQAPQQTTIPAPGQVTFQPSPGFPTASAGGARGGGQGGGGNGGGGSGANSALAQLEKLFPGKSPMPSNSPGSMPAGALAQMLPGSTLPVTNLVEMVSFTPPKTNRVSPPVTNSEPKTAAVAEPAFADKSPLILAKTPGAPTSKSSLLWALILFIVILCLALEILRRRRARKKSNSLLNPVAADVRTL